LKLLNLIFLLIIWDKKKLFFFLHFGTDEVLQKNTKRKKKVEIQIQGGHKGGMRETKGITTGVSFKGIVITDWKTQQFVNGLKNATICTFKFCYSCLNILINYL
jgi:hypothetical protein